MQADFLELNPLRLSARVILGQIGALVDQGHAQQLQTPGYGKS